MHSLQTWNDSLTHDGNQRSSLLRLLPLYCLCPFLFSFTLSPLTFGQTATLDNAVVELPKPPKGIAELFKLGDVKIQFYRQRPADQQYDGQTQFKINIDYRFQLHVQRVQTAQGVIARIRVTFTKIAVKHDIQISLPSSYAKKDIWETSLMLHELEHVLIDADPRITALLRKTVATIKTFNVPINLANQGNFKRMVADAIDKKVADMTMLIQKNNDLFDKVTVHGARPEDRDPNFFLRLYMEDNLKEQAFADLKSVKTLIRSERYRNSVKRLAEQPPSSINVAAP
ncbi:MAG: hypothetical protein VXZ82_17305 [Planctomycetota bacterium]|nr:hypothetical protein [Planctomycetota bacterium]